HRHGEDDDRGGGEREIPALAAAWHDERGRARVDGAARRREDRVVEMARRLLARQLAIAPGNVVVVSHRPLPLSVSSWRSATGSSPLPRPPRSRRRFPPRSG